MQEIRRTEGRKWGIRRKRQWIQLRGFGKKERKNRIPIIRVDKTRAEAVEELKNGL